MNKDPHRDFEFAKSVVIALVKSPLYNESISNQLDSELRQYFSSEKTLSVGDYFFIKSILNPNIYYEFKVVEVEPETLNQFKVDSNRTTLSQKSSIQDKWIWQKNNAEQNPNIVLDSYINHIEKIVNFYYSFSQSSDDSLPILMIYGPSGCGKTRCVEQACANLSLHLNKINSVNLAGESPSAIEKRLEIFVQNSIKYGPCVMLFKSFQYLFKLKDVNDCNKRIVSYFFQLIKRVKSKVDASRFFVVCTSNSKSSIDPSISSCFNHELEIKNLNEEERKQFLVNEFQSMKTNVINYDQFIKELVKKSASLFYGEMKTFCDLIKSEFELVEDSNSLTENEIESAASRFLSNRKFAQENRLNVEKVRWSDVGGLEPIKEIIVDTILLPLTYPSLFTSSSGSKSNGSQLGLTRSGILLYGAPGTGKTLLAKAIASECQLNFLSVKGPELLDMYVGQTELNVRALFEKARLNAPCVLFFDELDSLAPVRGRAGDSGGVMDRVVSQLLTEIDGMDKYSEKFSNSDSKSAQIFLIGATNRPDLIDPSLLRPGRFDKLIYVPIPKSNVERANILKALLRKLPVEKEFNVDEFIEQCPHSLSGADFYSITNRARQICLKRLIIKKENDDIDSDSICLVRSDFEDAIVDFRPTLSESELVNYEKYFNNLKNVN